MSRPMSELTDEELRELKYKHADQSAEEQALNVKRREVQKEAQLVKFNNDYGIVSALDLFDKDFPEPNWIIPEIIPEGLTILAGKPKTGKSWFALQLCAALSVGGAVLGDIQVERRRVLYLALEDTEKRIQSRMQELEASPSRDLFFQTKWKQEDIGVHLAYAYDLYPDIGFIIIDTLQKVRGKIKYSKSLYELDYEEISRIKQVADHTGIPILCLHHVRKTLSDDALETVSGSFGLTGAADTILVLKRSRGTGDADLFITGRDIKEEREIALQFQDHIGWVQLGDAEEYRQSLERQEIITFMRDSGEAVSPKQVASAIGRKDNAVSVMMYRMVKDGTLSKEGYGKYIYM